MMLKPYPSTLSDLVELVVIVGMAARQQKASGGKVLVLGLADLRLGNNVEQGVKPLLPSR